MSGSVSSNQPTPAQDVAKMRALFNDNGFLGHDENNDLSLPRDPKTRERYRRPAEPYFMSSQSTVIEQNS